MAAVFESDSRIKEVHIEGLVSETRPTSWTDCRVSPSRLAHAGFSSLFFLLRSNRIVDDPAPFFI